MESHMSTQSARTPVAASAGALTMVLGLGINGCAEPPAQVSQTKAADLRRPTNSAAHGPLRTDLRTGFGVVKLSRLALKSSCDRLLAGHPLRCPHARNGSVATGRSGTLRGGNASHGCPCRAGARCVFLS